MITIFFISKIPAAPRGEPGASVERFNRTLKESKGCDQGRRIKFRVVLRVRLENPKSKSQIPNKFQGLKFQSRGFALALEFGVWSLFEVWVLGFGISRTDVSCLTLSSMPPQML
jgi:hypothetical protein